VISLQKIESFVKRYPEKGGFPPSTHGPLPSPAGLTLSPQSMARMALHGGAWDRVHDMPC
jgi:hypothetical protein